MASSSQAPDLDAYPVIRIDHIPLLSQKILDTAYADVGELLSVMHSKARAGESVPKLAYYLQKQVDAMRVEISRRSGGESISSRLDSAAALLSAPLVSPRPQHTLVLKSSSSESRRRDRPPLEVGDGQTVKSSTSESSRRPDPLAQPPPMRSFVLAEPAHVAAAATATAERESGFSGYGNLAIEAPKRRPPKQETLTFRADTSHRFVETINKNFATSFIVAATEEKRRFLPKKKEVKLTEEQVRDRERQARREAATARLQARRVTHKRKRPPRVMEAAGKAQVDAGSGDDSISEEEEEEEAFADGPPTAQADLATSAKSSPLVDPSMISATSSAVVLPISTSPISSKTAVREREGAKEKEGRKKEKRPKPLALAPKKDDKPERLDREAAMALATAAANEYHAERRKSRERIVPRRAGRKEETAPGAEATDQVDDSRPASAPHPIPAPVPAAVPAPVPSPVPSPIPSPVPSPVPAAVPEPQDEPQPQPESPSRSRKLDAVAASKSGAALEVVRRMRLEKKNSLKDLSAQADASAAPAAPAAPVLAADSAPLEAPVSPVVAPVPVVAALAEAERPSSPAVSITVSPAQRALPLTPSSLPIGSPVAFKDILGAPAATPEIESPSKKDLLSGLEITPLQAEDTPGSRVRKRSLSQLELSPALPAARSLMLQHTDGDVPYYSCSRGPDELIGLRVWRLSDISAEGAVQWQVSMDEFGEAVSDEELLQLELLRLTRSTQRRRVSAGLVALVLQCEALMTGERFFESEDLLVAAWQWALVSFDDMASHLQGAQADKLFDEVLVCGNGHAVCRKLKNLVKSRVFAFESSNSCFSQDATGLPASAEEAPGRLQGQTSGTFMNEVGVECIEEEEDEEDEEDEEEVGGEREAVADRPWSSNGDQAISFLGNCNLDERHEDGNGDDDDDDDDDGSIMPLYPTPQKPSPSAQAPPLPLLRPAGPTSPAGMSALQPAAPQTSSLAPPGVAAKRMWKSLFSHFGMIFPAAHGAAGTATGLPTPNVFKALVTCMELQGKMYDEWLEVMHDLSTALGASDGSARPAALHYRVNSSRPEVYNIVTDAFRGDASLAGWEELPAGLGLGATWNLLWTWSKPKINLQHLLIWQRVNHFHDSKQLTRKDLLKKNLQRYTDMKTRAAEAFEIMPQTFLLPHEYIHFVQAFQEIEATRVQQGVQNYWIMKPVGMSRGRGISLVRDVSSLAYSQTSVIQRYVERPLCLDGYKFDLRLYVLVTSFRPLEAFIYKEGFARVSTQLYSLDGSEMANKFVHLTNSSIQKLNAAGPSRDNPLRNNTHAQGGRRGADGDEGADNGGGSKLTLGGPNGLWRRLQAAGLDTDQIWRGICQLVLKSLVVVDDKMAHQPCSFELFGFDVLLDADLRPWLIEVNASPSLARENAIDNQIKNVMIRDSILLVDPPAFDRAAAARVFKRRAAEYARSGDKSNLKNDAELQADLDAILGQACPRAYGDEPRCMGGYERLCPGTKLHEQVLRLKGKLFKS